MQNGIWNIKNQQCIMNNGKWRMINGQWIMVKNFSGQHSWVGLKCPTEATKGCKPQNLCLCLCPQRVLFLCDTVSDKTKSKEGAMKQSCKCWETTPGLRLVHTAALHTTPHYTLHTAFEIELSMLGNHPKAKAGAHRSNAHHSTVHTFTLHITVLHTTVYIGVTLV